ncbi:ParB N-terminal domain-containing protein [Sphaerospermopsis sp. LEGE 08334]|jgi:ParB-like chromosome segregation protein Spo0J|uniref:ParB/RepB/Spo0J family partition protein n=1 Tax=Sphaerospermopsis sp. LEGE 08334 TaxID=1828651 RepID=UPI00187F0692|nr:ParB N-terminal domain-containing protein [Sphaerospermopsis sp. LEGE 08334]MBE9057523.1 ParB N-terminal domain-containing protein [Sphaerospermopsis sp. LEGE 08334]
MSNIQIIKKRKVAELKPHPKNESIYGDEDIQELAQSIKENGLSDALIITPDGRIISGHRRCKAVKLLGWETVNVIEIEFPNEAEELKALLLKNQVRRITIEQICREGIMWEAILSPKSLQRRRDKNGSQGTTRDKVAALIGLESGSTFYKGKRVVQAIDEAEKNGDIAKATRLREALNKKINSGDELREVLSYIDKADKFGYIDEAEALKKVYEENGIHAAFTSPVLTMLKKNIKSGKKQALPTQTNKENGKKQASQTQSDNNQKESDVKQSQTQHTQTQWVLAKLGQKICGSVWIASDNRSDIWDNEKLGGFSIDALPNLGIGNQSQKIVKYIDVVWLSGDNHVNAAFEVECTTSIYSGLLRLADLIALSPNLTFPVYIVLPKSRVNNVIKELSRACFKGLKLDKKCRWIFIEDLLKEWEAILKYGTVESIIEIAHSIDSFKVDNDD